MKEMNEKDLNRLLEIEKKYQKVKDQQQKNWKRREAKRSLFCKKASAAGITVTEKEIDQYLNDHK